LGWALTCDASQVEGAYVTKTQGASTAVTFSTCTSLITARKRRQAIWRPVGQRRIRPLDRRRSTINRSNGTRPPAPPADILEPMCAALHQSLTRFAAAAAVEATGDESPAGTPVCFVRVSGQFTVVEQWPRIVRLNTGPAHPPFPYPAWSTHLVAWSYAWPGGRTLLYASYNINIIYPINQRLDLHRTTAKTATRMQQVSAI